MKLYPVLLDLEGRTATIIGGGEVALRKARDLCDAGATVRVIAPAVHPDLSNLAHEYPGGIEILLKPYEPGDLAGSFLAYTTSDNAGVNRAAANEAESLGIPVNVTDDPAGSTFFVPSFVRSGDFLLAVSTGGASPAMAARLRRDLQKHVPSDIGDILDVLSRARDILKSDKRFSSLSSSTRGDILRSLAGDDDLLADMLRSDREGRLADFLMERSG